jgi:hypothetical protein
VLLESKDIDMSILTEGEIIRMMRDEYRKRLTEVLDESDVFDDRGNMIIGKDLKVRHKDTQYEYTVDDVEENPETGDTDITLNLPEKPRIDPPADPLAQGTDRYKIKGPKGSSKTGEEEVFMVDQEEFEKEYEVK